MATTQVLLWLPEETLAVLRARAAARGGKGALSLISDEALRAGLGLVSAAQAETSALPAVEAVVRRVVAEQSRVDTERLAALLVKTCREASVARWLAYAAILRTQGRAVADADMERAFTAAARVLRGKTMPAAPGTDAPPEAGAGKADG